MRACITMLQFASATSRSFTAKDLESAMLGHKDKVCVCVCVCACACVFVLFRTQLCVCVCVCGVAHTHTHTHRRWVSSL